MFDGIMRLLRGPQALFIWGLLTKWYIVIIAPAAIMTVYYFFSGLESTGILGKIEATVVSALEEVKTIAKDCTPKLLDLKEFIRCLPN